jgi:CheY-like chemotaxis protein
VSARILVVEDDHDLRVTLRQSLESEGYTVMTAPNGRDALAYLKDAPRPALVLLDLMMPIMTGWELLEIIQQTEAYASVPVVVSSATYDERVAQRAREYLRKPLDLPRLIEIVDSYCQPR